MGLLASCASYKADLMLQPFNKDGKFDSAQVVKQLPPPPKEYRVQPGDFLLFRIFTNNGESILDPNGELRFGAPAGQGSVAQPATVGGGGASSGPAGGGGAAAAGGGGGVGADNTSSFEVMPDGQVRLPLVGFVPVAGLTLLRIDSLLERKFSAYYKEVYVESRIGNQRVMVLGGVGGGGRVIPLTYQSTSLLEVLALAGGLAPDSRANNIRLIRGTDQRTAQVQLIDLSTLEGMRLANAQVIANDVVYIEPVRRPFIEALRDNFRLFSIITGVTAAISLILRVLQ